METKSGKKARGEEKRKRGKRNEERKEGGKGQLKKGKKEERKGHKKKRKELKDRAGVREVIGFSFWFRKSAESVLPAGVSGQQGASRGGAAFKRFDR